MAAYPLHLQVAAVEAAAKADPSNGALITAAATLREVAVACAPTKHTYSDCPTCHNNWQVDAWPHDDRLTRAMEGLMP
ncbi:hypothetical protein [Azospirillum agricola]|uniref:hypothetical protein n=1 Tax=Azospirillum agricola TaxID=1720247 RepID=UPI000A0EF3D6|nr:hypothetical protein [Azospirillum agricola]SMH62557.1 hypothetical protein SAMN02982994_6360 [Azospirillum lipoferum]